MPKGDHTFATDSGQRVVVAYSAFCSAHDYVTARANQLRALNCLMVMAADAIGDLETEMRSDLLWLSQMLPEEIADAMEQLGLNEPQACM